MCISVCELTLWPLSGARESDRGHHALPLLNKQLNKKRPSLHSLLGFEQLWASGNNISSLHYVLYKSLTILIHVYVYKDISFWKMTIPLINLGKILVWKNDNSIDQPRFNIQGRVGARRLVGANLWLARSAKNNLIDGLFSFSQLQKCANTFSSIFNVIHQHTELHIYNEIKIYLEPF